MIWRKKFLCAENFELETNTVWAFPDRGKWATHDAKYRGNWSPYIPRNLILRYSTEGDTVLDPFVGGGQPLSRLNLQIEILSVLISIHKQSN